MTPGLTPGRSELDLRLGWTLQRRLAFSIVGQNLLHDQHPEFGAASWAIERSVFAKVTWSY